MGHIQDISPTDVFDVVVVGAGIAGLVTVHNIKKKDPTMKIIVFEARDRVGGRTYTTNIKVRNNKVARFDLGAQWVGVTQDHIMDLIDELGLEKIPQYCTGTKFMRLAGDKISTYETERPTVGSWLELYEYNYFMNKLNKLSAKVPMSDPYSSELANEMEGMTVACYADKLLWSTGAKKAIDQAIKGNFGTDASRLGMLFCLAYANAAGGMDKIVGIRDSAQEFRLKTGTQAISNALADKIGRDKIMLSHAVCSIDQEKEENYVHVGYKASNNESTVLLGDTKYVRAKKVVFAVPPHLLLKVEWNPPLHPLKKFLGETLQMGHLYKFFVTYDEAHWRKAGYSGEVFSNGGPKVVPECSAGPENEIYDSTTHDGHPAIVGFFAGRGATEWCQKTKKEREAAVISRLVEYFGPKMRNYITYEDKMWGEDPWAGGCPVMYGTPGSLFALPSIRTPQGRIHFAGTETATIWTGYMSGAAQSGERAAFEVLHDLRPHLLNERERQIARKAERTEQFLAQPRRSFPLLKTIFTASAAGIAGMLVKSSL